MCRQVDRTLPSPLLRLRQVAISLVAVRPTLMLLTLMLLTLMLLTLLMPWMTRRTDEFLVAEAP